jgi:multidrug efflux pump subunit AcrA (membrane-fusion protein)
MKNIKKVKKRVFGFFKKLLSTKKGKIIFAVLVIIITFVFWRLLSSKKVVNQVQTETVQKGTIVSSVTASGSIISSNIENITTQASGTVKKVYVNDGDLVKKGQLIAEIELDTQGQQNQAQAYSTYISAAQLV